MAAPGTRIALFGNAGGGASEPQPPVCRLIGGNVALAGFSMSDRLAAGEGAGKYVARIRT